MKIINTTCYDTEGMKQILQKCVSWLDKKFSLSQSRKFYPEAASTFYLYYTNKTNMDVTNAVLVLNNGPVWFVGMPSLKACFKDEFQKLAFDIDEEQYLMPNQVAAIASAFLRNTTQFVENRHISAVISCSRDTYCLQNITGDMRLTIHPSSPEGSSRMRALMSSKRKMVLYKKQMQKLNEDKQHHEYMLKVTDEKIERVRRNMNVAMEKINKLSKEGT